jgi:hypothetical protein
MAKILKNIFIAGVDEIVQDYTVESWHVSQSVDAFTGASDYDITISGSLDVTGPLDVTGNSSVSGYSTVNGFIIYNTGSNIAIVESSIFTPSTDVGKSLNVRLGYAAGQSTADTIGSNIIGSSAGVSAQSASYSNFLGMGAGGFATFASGSNFIGYVAGQFSSLASYSNLFGYNVGRGDIGGDSIGSNNIIIGTNISLPYNYRNGINIGAVIFGSGSYATPTGNVFSGSVGNGRIGINQPNPSFNLDVSGSGRYTNGVTVTGSFISSGSLSILSTGSITLNGPITLTGSLSTSGSVNLRGLTTESKSFLVTIDNTTGQLYYTSSAAAIAATTPGGSSTQIQYNNGGAFGGVPTLTYDGTTLRSTGSFTGSFVGNLTGTASFASITNDYTINYNNNPNSSNQILFGIGTKAYGNFNFTVNPNTGYVTANSYVASDYFRSTGATGWYNSTYDGGIYMIDSTWVRVYADKAFRTGNTSTAAIVASGDIVAYFSDERLKEKISNVDNALDKVLSLNGFYYKNNDFAKSVGYTDENIQLGLSAQEIQKVAPEIVKLAAFDMETDEEGNIISKSGEDYLTVNYAKLVPILVEAIKEQQKQIEDLKSKIK